MKWPAPCAGEWGGPGDSLAQVCESPPLPFLHLNVEGISKADRGGRTNCQEASICYAERNFMGLQIEKGLKPPL